MPRRLRTLRLAAVLAVLFPFVLGAQGGPPRQASGVSPSGGSAVLPFTGDGWQDKVLAHAGYVMPPRELADAVLAPRYLNLSLANPSPDTQWFLEDVGDGPVPMSVFSKPFHELGGVFLDYQAHRARSMTIRNSVGIHIVSAADGTVRKVQLPAGARVSNPIWAPDSKSVAFYLHAADATHIWIADVATGRARQLTVQPVLATLITTFEFTDDGKHIASLVVPDGRAPMPPQQPVAPAGPEIKIASGNKASLRTFPSLMSSQHDFEGPTTVPQHVFVNGATRKQLTNNEDIAPDLTRAPKHTVEVTRPDGIRFDLSVMLPPGYQPGTKLPAIFWIYPSEYDGQEAYDRPDRTFNKNAFPNFGARSMQFFARLGYAVITDTTGRSGTAGVPIVGPAGRQNDNYINDLRNNLAAAIDELERRGFIDRTRLAIGGHSYGAFSTVNAMVSTPYFKAGIAGDGAYNRTLTPFGFQNERRTLWQAPNVYFEMSPFLHVDHLSGALLLYHGLADQNVGTDPINSERLFQALNELGKTAAMYRYPLEDHGPAARETLLDLWSRWAAWLDKHVKSAGQPVIKPAANAQR